jgi:hypothetical protein
MRAVLVIAGIDLSVILELRALGEYYRTGGRISTDPSWTYAKPALPRRVAPPRPVESASIAMVYHRLVAARCGARVVSTTASATPIRRTP